MSAAGESIDSNVPSPQASTMIVRMLLATLAFLAAASAGPAAARPGQECREPTSPRISIEQLQSDIERWFGRCVRLVGIRDGNRLLADREAMLEVDRPDEEIRRSIVIYPQADLVFNLPQHAVRVVILGRVGSCRAHHEATAAYSQEHPGLIAWTSGYCHTSLENYIEPHDISLLSRRPIARLTEAEIDVRRRQLVQAPPGPARRDDWIAAGSALVAAIAANDENAFLRLTNPPAGHDLDQLRGGPEPEWLAEDRAEARQRLARLRSMGSPFRDGRLLEGQPQLMVERSALEEVSFSRGFGGLIICWCRDPSCAGRWPIMLRDADARRDRPYACVKTGDFLISAASGRAVQAEVADDDSWLTEPAWPRDAPPLSLSP